MHNYVVAIAEADTGSTVSSITFFDQIFIYLSEFARNFVSVLIVFIVGVYLCRFACRFVRHYLEKSKIDPAAAGFINSLVKLCTWGLLAIIIITMLGVDMSSIVALITSAALAVGLALQGHLSNFAGGVMLLITRPFAAGDYIRDEEGHEGTVESIDICYTRIITPDNQIIYIPNGSLSNTTITNVNHLGRRRMDFKVSIDYSENIYKARQALLRVASESEYVLKDEDIAPQVLTDSFESSAIIMILRIWCESENYWPAKFAIQEAIKNVFDEEGIVIPYEHLDVKITNG